MKNKCYTTRSDCNTRKFKRYHYTRKKGAWKAKVPFESEQEAVEYIKKHNMVNYVAYICPSCGKWHIGSNPSLAKAEQ
jgi:hypothetical protein